MRPTKSEYLLLVAEAVAKRATCPRRTVGCVLADKQARILATGYNGGLRGDPHCGTEDYEYKEGGVYATVGGHRVLINERIEHSAVKAPGLAGIYYVKDGCCEAKWELNGRCWWAQTEPPHTQQDYNYLNLKPNVHGCAGLHDQPGQPSRCEAVHAELNALLQCRHREEVVFVACTTSPCLACARALVQGLVNLETVFYRDAYCNKEGLELLERRRVRCEQVKGGGQ